MAAPIKPERSLSHGRDRLACEHELPDIDVDLVHAGQKKIVSPAGIDDQESTVGPEGPREGTHPSAGDTTLAFGRVVIEMPRVVPP